MPDSSDKIKQLRATLSKMEIALSTVDESIVWTDLNGKIKWCNGAFDRFLGQPHILILGQLLFKKLPLYWEGQSIDISEHPVTLALETKNSGKQCYEYIKNNQILILEITWSFVEISSDLTNSQDASSAVLVIRDITQQKELEKKNQEAKENLEKLVETRTQELREANDLLAQEAQELQQLLRELKQTQTQLIQSEKMSSLGQLVAGIAHEINNPVNFIYGNLIHLESNIRDLMEFLQLYQEYYPNPVDEIKVISEEIEIDFLEEDLPKLIDSMKIGTKRIREIVLSLRNFSRMDEAEFKIVNIHEGIDNTLLILQHRFKGNEKHCAIKVTRNYQDLPEIECYPGQLNQVFMNILANAIDAIEELNDHNNPDLKNRHPEIKISTSLLNEQWVKIVIADNGIGISETVKKQIFNPFFTTKAVGKGTGMGMAISYQIIREKHNGEIDCFSTLYEGTKFIISIPIKQTPKIDN